MIPVFTSGALWLLGRSHATPGEQALIHDFQKNLNDKKSRRRPYMRWLVRSSLHKQLTEPAINDSERWSKNLTARRLDLQTLDALRILVAAKRALPPSKFNPLQTRMLTYRRAHAQIPLPRTLTLHVPFVGKDERVLLRKACADFFRDTPYPRAVGAYMASVLGIPMTIPPKMLQLWCKDTLKESYAHYTLASEDNNWCGCQMTMGEETCVGVCLYRKDTLVSTFGRNTK